MMRRTFLKLEPRRRGLSAACTACPSRPKPRPAAARWFTARYADSLFLDPVLNDANVDIWVLTNLYDTLLAARPRTAKACSRASPPSGSLSDDGKSVILTLRPGVKFADGSALTAEDVKWSLDRARDPKAGAWSPRWPPSTSIDAKDPGRVVLTLKHPDPTCFRRLRPSTARSCRRSSSRRRRRHAGGQGQGLRREADRHRPVHHDRVEARRLDDAEAQPLLLEAGRGREGAALSRRARIPDHPGRRDPAPEAEGRRDRRRPSSSPMRGSRS